MEDNQKDREAVMRISRIRLINFANFSDVDVETGESIVIVGENKVGKSNFIRGLQLILDPALSERDRQLGFEHFWDGLGEDKLGETIEISVDFTDFTDDPRLMAHLNDCVLNPGLRWWPALPIAFSPKPS
ncbi:AAA family ATPase [Escherichia coli]|uniref:AAA family ATPase n=1 Tax=Escherichia coli TaxID=562 RepID=UPI0020B1AABA|nr:AAA family ATPase [Escherichia coli]